VGICLASQAATPVTVNAADTLRQNLTAVIGSTPMMLLNAISLVTSMNGKTLHRPLTDSNRLRRGSTAHPQRLR
jgi:hypothetical protein